MGEGSHLLAPGGLTEALTGSLTCGVLLTVGRYCMRDMGPGMGGKGEREGRESFSQRILVAGPEMS